MSTKVWLVVVLAASALPFGGCILTPVEPVVGVYAPPPVVVAPQPVIIDPFPHVWVGPGYYGGRYYESHPYPYRSRRY